MGKDATALERKGVKTRVANDNNERAQRNLHAIRIENLIRQRREDLRSAFTRRQTEERSLSAKHKVQAQFLNDRHKAQAKSYYDQIEKNIAIRRAAIKQNFRPAWGALFKQQRAEKRALNAAQKSAPARLAWFFKNRDPKQRAPDIVKDAARAVFGRDNPHGALSRKHHAERRALADMAIKQIKQAAHEENRSYRQSLDRLSEQHRNERERLSEQHRQERDALKEAHTRESQNRARDIAGGKDFERFHQDAQKERIAQEFNARVAEQMRKAREREAQDRKEREQGRDRGEERER
jgi:hypothetical protein